MNDSPGCCQSRAVTDPQREVSRVRATDEATRFAPNGARSEDVLCTGEDALSVLMKCPAHAGREKRLKKKMTAATEESPRSSLPPREGGRGAAG